MIIIDKRNNYKARGVLLFKMAHSTKPEDKREFKYDPHFLESYETRGNSRGAMEGVTFNVRPEDIRIFDVVPKEKPYNANT